MRFALALLSAAVVYAGAALSPEESLEQARAKIQSMTHRLANYACVETVNRKYFRRAEDSQGIPDDAPVACRGKATSGLALEATDRLRLEVTVSQGGEIQSWPGATAFDSRGVDEMIRQGPIAAGAFATYLIDVFDNPGVVFHYNGEKPNGPQKVMEFSYHVPLEASHYRVKEGGDWKPTAYDGVFWLDAASLELEKLTLKTAPLPQSTSICEADTALEYRQVHIGDGDVLLPRQSELHIDLRSARETDNLTTFSECREYEAESTVSFGDGDSKNSSAAKLIVRSPVAMTIGLPITLALDSPIDTDIAAAGDAISAKVVKPVHRPGSNEALIPPGATVRGRITRVERHLFPTPYFLIAISFNRLELKGGSSPFAARLDQDPDLARRLNADLAGRGRGVEYWDVGTFLLPTNKSRYVLPAGYQSKWFTLAIGAR